MTNDPSKMVGGADGFICDVISRNDVDKTWTVRPRIVEIDGKDHPTIKVNAVNGLYPQTGDVVFVVTARNNLDDKKISRFYPPTESNGRIVAIAKPLTMYVFKGDYKIDGDVLITGDFTVEGDSITEGDSTIEGDGQIDGELTVDVEITVGPTNIEVTRHGHITPLGPTVGPILPIQ